MTQSRFISRDALVAEILLRAASTPRLIVAIAGAPAAGKSTLAEQLCGQINAGFDHQPPAIVVPMDGFHYDNMILDARGDRLRKGAPHTFDIDGFTALLARLKAADQDVTIPVFDRAMDLARAGAAMVTLQQRILLVEGNYLLLNQPAWRCLPDYFDLSVFLQVPEEILQQRLIRRWLDHGADYEAAKARALANDIPNAQVVIQCSQPADFILQD